MLIYMSTQRFTNTKMSILFFFVYSCKKIPGPFRLTRNFSPSDKPHLKKNSSSLMEKNKNQHRSQYGRQSLKVGHFQDYPRYFYISQTFIPYLLVLPFCGSLHWGNNPTPDIHLSTWLSTEKIRRLLDFSQLIHSFHKPGSPHPALYIINKGKARQHPPFRKYYKHSYHFLTTLALGKLIIRPISTLR